MQREGHRKIRVVYDIETTRNAAFYRTAKTVTDAGGNVADPRGHHAGNAACADHLVEKNIGDGPDEREVAAALANQFVACSERNHLLELRAEQDHRARWNVTGDGVAHGEQFGFGGHFILSRPE